jgi:3-hydroxy acid dehydrogenase/malonic semialdehyde reductase
MQYKRRTKLDIKNESRGTVIVAGASYGSGRQTSLRFAEEGFTVIALARTESALKNLSDSHENITAYSIDLSNKEEISKFGDYISDMDVSILVNVAGGGIDYVPVEYSKEDHLQQCFDINVFYVFNMSKVLIPIFKKNKRGHIINITSTAADNIFPGSNSYSAAKKANSVITESLRFELHQDNIRVTEIAPGTINGRQPREVALSSSDVAEAIFWVSQLPETVNINKISMAHTKSIDRPW